MRSAIRVDLVKLTRSRVGLIATLAIVVGIIALLGGLTAGVAGGSPQIIAKAGPAATLDWSGLLAGAAQIGSVAVILGFGIVLAWIFGREFADETITGLFALPISRGRIALAKLTVYVGWSGLVSIALATGVLALGLLLGYGPPTGKEFAELGRLCALGMLSAVVALPAAWIATVSRSVLAAVGCTIALVVTAQAGVLAGAGAWMPPAAPALWAMSNGAEASALQLTVTAAVGLAFAVCARTSWARLQLDR